MREPTFKYLVQSGKASAVVIKSTTDGFVVFLGEGDAEEALEARRGHTRVFKKLDTLAAYLRANGVTTVTLQLPDPA